MGHRRAVAGEETTDLGQGQAASHMRQIHRHLPCQRRARTAARCRPQLVADDMECGRNSLLDNAAQMLVAEDLRRKVQVPPLWAEIRIDAGQHDVQSTRIEVDFMNGSGRMIQSSMPFAMAS